MWNFLTKARTPKLVQRNHHHRDRQRLRPGLEVLEDRTVPAVLSRTPFLGDLTYQAGSGVANSLRISYDSVSTRYTFAETAEPITSSGIVDLDPDPYRVVFSASIHSITVLLGDRNDSLVVASVIDPLKVQAGTGEDTVTVLSTGAAATVNGSDGNDRIHIGGQINLPPGSLDSIAAPVVVSGGAGSDQLWVHDWADGSLNTYEITNTRVYRAGVAIDYDNSMESVRLEEGSGVGRVNVWSTSPTTAVTVNLQAGGADAVHIGGPNNSLDTILGPVTILGEISPNAPTSARDSVYLHDEGDSNANSYTLAVRYLTSPVYSFPLVSGTVARSGAALITYENGLASLNLYAGRGDDQIQVRSTAAGAQTVVLAGAGNDKIYVGEGSSVAGIQGSLIVNGQEGFDALSIDGRAEGPDPFVRDFTTVRRSGRIVLTYSSIEDFVLLP
jgi:hypothetical protein